MLKEYLRRERERAQLGIPALPLTPEQVASLCGLLAAPPSGQEQLLLALLRERVSPASILPRKSRPVFSETSSRVKNPRH